jgi:hypothetical protein
MMLLLLKPAKISSGCSRPERLASWKITVAIPL